MTTENSSLAIKPSTATQARKPAAESAEAPLMISQEEIVPWSILLGLILVLVWGYWKTMGTVVHSWSDDQYSHGFLIPLFAVVILWLRRKPIDLNAPMSQRWCGVAIVGVGLLAWLYGTHSINFSLERLSMLIVLSGIFVLVGGWQALSWSWPAILFLIFMFPWPDFMVTSILRNLQTVAVGSTYYVLQTLGIQCVREGSLIMIGESEMDIADRCSGLRMLTIFIALSYALVVFMNNRPLWERVVILLSAIPIALVVNITRITSVGIMHWFDSTGENAEFINGPFHDYSGYAMIVLAFGLLFLEMKILAALTIDLSAEAAEAVKLVKTKKAGESVPAPKGAKVALATAQPSEKPQRRAMIPGLASSKTQKRK